MKVRDLMTSSVSCVKTSDTLQHAAQQMASINVGSVPVCEQKRLVGILTDRDITLKAVAKGQSEQMRVQDCMTRQVVTCTPDTDAHEAADLMANHQVRRLPVTDSRGDLVGMLAIADLATENIHVNEAGDALSRISKPTEAQNAFQ
ncbi:CBS domain-containing protein [Alicyclobacillaceae bacterium I2511]|nr:CBS domain-containing protein [Alicyclobacillaceae bacterium I2511]